MELRVRGEERRPVGLGGVVKEGTIGGESLNETVPDEGRAAGAKLTMAVEDGEEVCIYPAMEVGPDDEAVLVLAIRRIGVVTPLAEGGVVEAETSGGDQGRAYGVSVKRCAL